MHIKQVMDFEVSLQETKCLVLMGFWTLSTVLVLKKNVLGTESVSILR
jgi:hypothetical protein